MNEATYIKIKLPAYGRKFYRPVVVQGPHRQPRQLHKICKTASEAIRYAERALARYRSFCDLARLAEWAKERTQ